MIGPTNACNLRVLSAWRKRPLCLGKTPRTHTLYLPDMPSTISGQIRDIWNVEASARFVVTVDCSLPIHVRFRGLSSVQAIGVPSTGWVPQSVPWRAFDPRQDGRGEACYCCCAFARVDDQFLMTQAASRCCSGRSLVDVRYCCRRHWILLCVHHYTIRLHDKPDFMTMSKASHR